MNNLIQDKIAYYKKALYDTENRLKFENPSGVQSIILKRDVKNFTQFIQDIEDMFAAPPPASEGELTGEDYRNLIDTHIGRMGELEKASIKHFIETGTINGSFNLRLVSLINFAVSLAKSKAALATLPTREPEAKDDDDGWMYCPNCGRIKIPD